MDVGDRLGDAEVEQANDRGQQDGEQAIPAAQDRSEIELQRRTFAAPADECTGG